MRQGTYDDKMWELTDRAVAGDITNDQFQRLIQKAKKLVSSDCNRVIRRSTSLPCYATEM